MKENMMNSFMTVKVEGATVGDLDIATVLRLWKGKETEEISRRPNLFQCTVLCDAVTSVWGYGYTNHYRLVLRSWK